MKRPVRVVESYNVMNNPNLIQPSAVCNMYAPFTITHWLRSKRWKHNENIAWIAVISGDIKKMFFVPHVLSAPKAML